MKSTSQPHGQHQIVCVEEHTKPHLRVYEIRDAPGLGTGRLGFTGEELDWLVDWWLSERTSTAGNQMREIRALRCLDDSGLEWEWSYGIHDFHVRYEAEAGTWLLEQFLTSESNAAKAHVDEQECETFQDALAFGLAAR